MNLVSDILADKGSNVYMIDKSAMVLAAIKKMVDHGCASLLVIEGETIRGIFTERDYLRRIVLEGRTSKSTPVIDVMTERLIVVEPSTSLEECMALMTRERVRHLPVLDKTKLAGIISIGDVVNAHLQETEFENRMLKDYIHGVMH